MCVCVCVYVYKTIRTRRKIMKSTYGTLKNCLGNVVVY